MYDLFPGVFATVEMIPDSIGDWMLHCHVNDHMTGGMETVYSVYGKPKKVTCAVVCTEVTMVNTTNSV